MNTTKQNPLAFINQAVNALSSPMLVLNRAGWHEQGYFKGSLHSISYLRSTTIIRYFFAVQTCVILVN